MGDKLQLDYSLGLLVQQCCEQPPYNDPHLYDRGAFIRVKLLNYFTNQYD